MSIHQTPAYKKAFTQYLRRGTPIHLSLKEDSHQTTHYVWHTSSDGDVRPSHAENDGKIFAWDNPPETGHPGEAPGCRCWAEDYYDKESAKEQIVSALEEIVSVYGGAWENMELSAYFYVGQGQPVSLEKIGHLDAIRDYYNANYLQIFIDQIREKAASVPDGSMSDDFMRPYSFYAILYSYRSSTMSGLFTGEVTTLPTGQRTIDGLASFEFHDEFKDPLEFRQIWVGLRNLVLFWDKITEKEAEMAWAELGGQPYAISSNWTMEIHEILDAK